MKYDLIVCGTGFASTFFLHQWLKKKPNSRILVIERGNIEDHWKLVNLKLNSTIDSTQLFKKEGLSGKEWLFTVGAGGGSNCWWGQTPRMWPEDFEVMKRFGVGYDWPITYSELEPYYEQAEELMQIAGPLDAPYPRRTKCPQPMHPVSGFDRRMMELNPGLWVPSPTARSSLGTAKRGKCCAMGVCGLCPVDAKFRVMNEMSELYINNPQVELKCMAEVLNIDIQAGKVKGVHWRELDREFYAEGDLTFLGMNALFNPNILINSGDKSPLTGKRLNEQVSKKIIVDFADVKGFNGGTHITSLGYMFYGGQQRKTRASCLIENYNAPARLRSDVNRWTSRAVMKIVAENLPENHNQVLAGDIPTARFIAHSDYALRALDEVPKELLRMLSSVSEIENVWIEPDVGASEGHILGTTVMSKLKEDGVVDSHLRHHRISNLVVGGSGCFPSSPGANPSLTIAALSLRSADYLS